MTEKTTLIKNHEVYKSIHTNFAPAIINLSQDYFPQIGILLESAKACKPERGFTALKNSVATKFQNLKIFFYGPKPASENQSAPKECADCDLPSKIPSESVPNNGISITDTKPLPDKQLSSATQASLSTQPSVSGNDNPTQEKPCVDKMTQFLKSAVKLGALIWLFVKIFPPVASKLSALGKLMPKINTFDKVKGKIKNEQEELKNKREELAKQITQDKEKIEQIITDKNMISKVAKSNKIKAPLKNRMIHHLEEKAAKYEYDLNTLTEKLNSCEKTLQSNTNVSKYAESDEVCLSPTDYQNLATIEKAIHNVLSKCIYANSTDYFSDGVSGIIYDQCFKPWGNDCPIFNHLV